MFGLSWGWAGDAFNATKRINTFLSCAMQLLVLVLAGLVFGFAWFGLLVVSSHLPERDLVSAYHLVLLTT